VTESFQPKCLWPLGAEVAEGVVWRAAEAAVYFVDTNAQQLHRYGPDGAQTTWSAPQTPGFLGPRPDGRLICGLRDGLYDFDPQTGAFTRLARVDTGARGDRINDGLVDRTGRVWFGTVRDPGDEKWSIDDTGQVVGLARDPSKDTPGRLYSREASGEVRLRDTGYAVTNGPALSPDGRTLYHADSVARVIYAFAVGADGALSGKRTFATFGEGDFPDGMVVDAAGGLWVAIFNGWRLEHYDPDGTKLREIRFPCAHVTKPTFGGDDLRTLYVTTARVGLSAAALAAQPLAGGLFAVRVETPGLLQGEAP